MKTYIMLFRFTQQGLVDIKGAPNRLDLVKDTFKKFGAELKSIYLVMGQYDLIAIIEAPDDETIAKLSLMVGSKGNVNMETLRAFTEEEYRKIVAGVI